MSEVGVRSELRGGSSAIPAAGVMVVPLSPSREPSSGLFRRSSGCAVAAVVREPIR